MFASEEHRPYRTRFAQMIKVDRDWMGEAKGLEVGSEIDEG